MKHQSQVRIKYAEGLLLLSSSASNHEDTLKEVIDLLEKEVHLNNNQSSLVQVYTLKGRYYANRHDYNHAKAYFESALSCVDVESNPLMWGRSLSNLGAVLIKQGQNIEAHDLLVRAAEIQATINDTTGWAVTHNNLALIHNTSK